MTVSRTDLHTHTTASDGRLSPAGLVQRASTAGVRRLAITDHDTVAGLGEGRAAVEGTEIELITGVELSVTWHGRTLHLVGLGFDPDEKRLCRGLAWHGRLRERRAERIAARLVDQGVEGALAGARREAGQASPGRLHFARHLLASGHARSLADAFRRFLGRGGPAHVPAEWVPMEEGIAWIRGAGGTVVLAHPLKYGFSNTWLRRIVTAFREAGGEGIEVVSGYGDSGRIGRAAALARRFGLRGSVGSDFHEPGRPWQEIGRLQPLPADIVPVWEGLR